MSSWPLDHQACYRAVRGRDRRFDGVFYTAVRTTGIYCRPSCPARTPAPANVAFHRTAAAAQEAGYRACKRCLPDATPGSPDWDVAADVAGRAMRLISDGVVDREGVPGLAARLGYTPRHLGRVLRQELGAGPLALARARRAQHARVLVETSDLPLVDIAFAAGFTSVRQFNDTVREVYDTTPSALRGRRTTSGAETASGTLDLRLAVRTPYAGAALLDFLARRAVPGVETVAEGRYHRTLDLPSGHGAVSLRLPQDEAVGGTAFAEARYALTDLRDLGAAVERTRRLLDADCDPVAVADALGPDPLIGPLTRRRPGLRVPGHVDGVELAVRAVLGQQVSVERARRLAGGLVEQHGRPIETPVPGLTHLFPGASTLAALEPTELPMPRSRGRALVALTAAAASGDLDLDRGAAREDVRAALLALPGIGPWTADYVALRALGDPDVFMGNDLGVRHAMAAAGCACEESDRWRPWRSYAQMHLWQSASADEGDQ